MSSSLYKKWGRRKICNGECWFWNHISRIRRSHTDKLGFFKEGFVCDYSAYFKTILKIFGKLNFRKPSASTKRLTNCTMFWPLHYEKYDFWPILLLPGTQDFIQFTEYQYVFKICYHFSLNTKDVIKTCNLVYWANRG